jgi:hypothetical protein
MIRMRKYRKINENNTYSGIPYVVTWRQATTLGIPYKRPYKKLLLK